MPLINCKAELKLRWTKYCVLSAGGNDNLNNIDNINNDNNIILGFIKGYIINPLILLKDLKDQFIGMNIKQKVIDKVNEKAGALR